MIEKSVAEETWWQRPQPGKGLTGIIWKKKTPEKRGKGLGERKRTQGKAFLRGFQLIRLTQIGRKRKKSLTGCGVAKGFRNRTIVLAGH